MASLEFVKKQKEILEEELTIDFTGCLNYGVVRYKLTPSVIENYKAILKKSNAEYQNKLIEKSGIKVGSEKDEKVIIKAFNDTVSTADMMELNFLKEKTIKEEFTFSFDDAPTKQELQTYLTECFGEVWKEPYDKFLEDNFNEFQELYNKFITPSK